MYTHRNFKTKKALKEAVKEYNDSITCDICASKDKNLGVTYFQPGPFSGNKPTNETFYVEGPHYPEAHKWYATCIAKGGIIISVK